MILASLAIGACSARIRGVYSAEGGEGRLEFREDGRVYVSLLGGTSAHGYEVDGDRVIVRGAAGSQVYTRRGELLDDGLGTRFVRR